MNPKILEQAVTKSDQIAAVLPVPGAVRFDGALIAQNVMAPSRDHLSQRFLQKSKARYKERPEILHI